jgi:hypothetical protein
VDTAITCTLRVTAPDRDIARVTARRQQFAVGRPLELDETSPRTSALEYALGALAAEVVNGLRVFAARRRVELDAVEALVTGELRNGLAWLEVVGEPTPPTIARIRLQVFVATPDETGVRDLWKDLLDRLPLACTLRVAVPFEIDLTITP